MTTQSKRPIDQLSPAARDMAMVAAVFVRNALEDIHASGGIPQDRMPEVNRAIRNALATFFHISQHSTHPIARRLFEYAREQIPDYWESPELDPQIVTLLTTDAKGED